MRDGLAADSLTAIHLTTLSHSTLGYAAFFITICVHTPYAEPWIYPCLAFYGLDLLFRMFRSRVKDAVLVPVGNQMTLVRAVIIRLEHS